MIQLIPNSNNRAERSLLILCLLIWSEHIIVNYGVVILNKITGIEYDIFYNVILPAVFVFFITSAYPLIKTKIKPVDYIFYVLVMLVFYFSYVLNADNREYLDKFFVTLPFICLPMYFAGVFFSFRTLKEQLYYISIISLIGQFVFVYFIAKNVEQSYQDMDDYMVQSYQILPYVLYTLYYAMESPNKYRIFWSLFGLFLVLSLGTRGPFLCLMIFIVTYILIFKFPSIGIIRKIIIASGSYIFYKVIVVILQPLLALIASAGGSARIIEWFLGENAGAEASSEQRLVIINQAIDFLERNNYMGMGFAGDRVMMQGFYVHNFVIELILSYGLILGSLLLIILAYRLTKGVFSYNIEDNNKFLLLLICTGLIPLFMSGSYVDNIWFYFMLGFCTQTLRTRKLIRN